MWYPTISTFLTTVNILVYVLSISNYQLEYDILNMTVYTLKTVYYIINILLSYLSLIASRIQTISSFSRRLKCSERLCYKMKEFKIYQCDRCTENQSCTCHISLQISVTLILSPVDYWHVSTSSKNKYKTYQITPKLL